MSDEAALLRAIIASPEDDAARLVYSDWLEEHGRAAQAEFIRTQLRLHAMRPWDDGYDELKLRERTLLERHAKSRLEPVRPYLHPSFDDDRDPHDHAVFRRGFVETAFVNLQRFLADPDGLFDAAPVTGLLFWILSPELPGVLDCPALARVKRLRFLSSDLRPARRGGAVQQGVVPEAAGPGPEQQ